MPHTILSCLVPPYTMCLHQLGSSQPACPYSLCLSISSLDHSMVESEEPAEKGDLWHASVWHASVRHPGQVTKLLQPSLLQLRSDGLHITPPLSLKVSDGMHSSHCCLLGIPSTVRMHLWRKESSLFRCLLNRVQLSPPYRSTDNTQAW